MDLLIKVIKDYASGDSNRRKEAEPFMDVLRDLFMMVLNIGDASQSLYHALLTLNSMNPNDVSERYRYFMEKLGKILLDTYEFRRRGELV
jgi:hypothetical protein